MACQIDHFGSLEEDTTTTTTTTTTRTSVTLATTSYFWKYFEVATSYQLEDQKLLLARSISQVEARQKLEAGAKAAASCYKL